MVLLTAITLLALAADAPEPGTEPPGVEPPESKPGSEASALPSPRTRAVLLLRDGGQLVGKLLSSGPHGEVIEFDSGDRVRLKAGSIVGFQALPVELPPLKMVDPLRRQYVTVPSALGPASLEWRLGMTASEAISAAVGLGYRFVGVEASLSASSPLFDRSSSPFIPLASVSGHLSVQPWLHLGGGARMVLGQDADTILLFGSVTAGTPALHVTFYAGPPMPGATRLGDFETVVVGAAAAVRLTRRFGLLAEFTGTPRRERPEGLGALAVRTVGTRNLAVDVGVLASTRGSVAPWFALGLTRGGGSP